MGSKPVLKPGGSGFDSRLSSALSSESEFIIIIFVVVMYIGHSHHLSHYGITAYTLPLSLNHTRPHHQHHTTPLHHNTTPHHYTISPPHHTTSQDHSFEHNFAFKRTEHQLACQCRCFCFLPELEGRKRKRLRTESQVGVVRCGRCFFLPVEKLICSSFLNFREVDGVSF